MQNKMSVWIVGTLSLTLWSAAAAAQWPPGDGLALADRDFSSNMPKIRATSDGGCYVSWFDDAEFGFDVYLQRLNATGEELWPHNGVKIADRNQDWTTDYGLEVDAADNALLAFRDDRYGILHLTVASTGPDGVQLWETAVSDGTFEPINPSLVLTADGGVTVAWSEYTDDGKQVHVQRLNAAGQLQWSAPLVLKDTDGGNFDFSFMTSSDHDNVILSWVRQGSQYWEPYHLWAQKISSEGDLLWGPSHVIVYDGVGLEVAERPRHVSDGQGGAVFNWHFIVEGAWYDVAIQHILTNGAITYQHNGLTPVPDNIRQRYCSALAYNQISGDTYLFWTELDVVGYTDYYAPFGQKFDGEGARCWGLTGLALSPWDTGAVMSPDAYPCSRGGAKLCWITAQPSGECIVNATRVNSAGEPVWSEPTLAVSTAPSEKASLSAAILASGMQALVWSDNRDGDSDIYVQNIFNDGTLGNCLADLNFDGLVDLSDLAQLLGRYGTTSGAAFTDGDIDADGDVDLSDLAALLGVYGMGCN